MDVDIFRFTEIAEEGVPILNPLSDAKLARLGLVARLRPGMTQLDLGCGKGEMLCRWARDHGIGGVGIDIHAPLVDEARRRASELGVESSVTFVLGDAATRSVEGPFDVVSCIGATWIGGGFVGTIELMRRSLRPGGVLLVGEVFVESGASLRPEDADERHGGSLRGMRDLGGLLDQVSEAGCTLDEMVLASRDDWDEYSSRQWDRAEAWLRANPSSPEAPGVRAFLDRSRRAYLADERGWLGWGVFVLRVR